MTIERDDARHLTRTDGGLVDQLPTKPRIQVPKIAEIVAASLRTQIIRGELNEGDTLPPEAELMAHFQVSRPTLREAFRILESESLLSIRRGAKGGAEIHGPSPVVSARSIGMLLQAMDAKVSDVHLARMIMEPPAARLTAEHLTAESMERLRAALEEERVATNIGHAAMEFHREVINCAGNVTLAILWGTLSHIIDAHHSAVFAGVGAAGADSHPDERKGYRAHSKLLRLLEEGDPVAVEKFWGQHLAEAGKFLLRRLPDEPLLNVMD